MTEKKRVVVNFSEEDWQRVQDMKRKFYDISYSELIRRAINEGYQHIMGTRPKERTTE